MNGFEKDIDSLYCTITKSDLVKYLLKHSDEIEEYAIQDGISHYGISFDKNIIYVYNLEKFVLFLKNNQLTGILKKIIVKSENLNDNIKDGWKLIHFICKYSTDEMVRYIIDIYLEKGFDLECITKNGWKPIHLICKYSTSETIKYIVDIYLQKGFDLQCNTNDNWEPIHFICRFSTPEMIKYILDVYLEKGFDLKCTTNDDWKPIHLICRFSTPEMIKYILDIYLQKGLDLKYTTIDGWKPIHLIFEHSTTAMIKYILKIYLDKGLVLTPSKMHFLSLLRINGFKHSNKEIIELLDKCVFPSIFDIITESFRFW